MKKTEAKAKLKGIQSFKQHRFKTITDGRNIIENTRKYTSKPRDKNTTKEYIGRISEFICEDGLHNRFIDLSKTDGKFTSIFQDGTFIETWKDTSKEEEIAEWKEGEKDLLIRLFLKSEGSDDFVCMGMYYYAGSSKAGILWKCID